MTRPRAMRALRVILCAAVWSAVAAPVRAQGVHVAILPTGQTVAPGSTFTLSLEVTQPGTPFNGFDAVVTYDPAALTFVPLSPTALQQGSYMLNACGNSPFHRFTAAADSLSITDVLLCANLALPGPGQIYKLKFTASNTPQVTHVRFRSAQFYDAGVFLPTDAQDAVIGIGVPVGIEAEVPAPVGPVVRAAPNPFRGHTSIQVVSPLEGSQRIFVRDVQGRTVRHLGEGRFAPGTRFVQWDGRDDAGRPLPPGVYRIVLHTEHAAAGARVALLR